MQQFTYRDLPADFSQRYSESVVTNPYYDVVDPALVPTAFRNGLDELMHAARIGFDAVAVTEHGSANYDMSPNPDLTAAAVAYATEVEQLDTAIAVIGRTLGKSREPRRIAEEYAVIDNISGGHRWLPGGLAVRRELQQRRPTRRDAGPLRREHAAHSAGVDRPEHFPVER